MTCETVNALLIDPESRAVVDVVMHLAPNRQPSQYTNLRRFRGKHILQRVGASYAASRFTFGLDGETFYGSWIVVGFDRDFRDVGISAKKLAGMIEWHGRTFATCLQAAPYRRLDSHRPTVARSVFGGCQ
jgi:hypothetical protein